MHLHVYSFIEILKCIEKSKKKQMIIGQVLFLYHQLLVNLEELVKHYSLSKAVLEAATITLNKELSVKKIRLNVVTCFSKN